MQSVFPVAQSVSSRPSTSIRANDSTVRGVFHGLLCGQMSLLFMERLDTHGSSDVVAWFAFAVSMICIVGAMFDMTVIAVKSGELHARHLVALGMSSASYGAAYASHNHFNALSLCLAVICVAVSAPLLYIGARTSLAQRLGFTTDR